MMNSDTKKEYFYVVELTSIAFTKLMLFFTRQEAIDSICNIKSPATKEMCYVLTQEEIYDLMRKGYRENISAGSTYRGTAYYTGTRGGRYRMSASGKSKIYI